MDKQREKLIELICTVNCEGGEDFLSCPERRNGHCRSIHKLEMCQLGAIADHLLADEEIKRAFELLKAEKEGRLIVPPCKVGDRVYSFCDTFGGVLEYFVENLNIAYFEEDRNYCTYEANCHMNDEFYDSIDFDYDDICKTVFLSREEAEKALEERKDN